MNIGGAPRHGEDGNVVGGRWVDMVVDGSDVFIVSSPFVLTLIAKIRFN